VGSTARRAKRLELNDELPMSLVLDTVADEPWLNTVALELEPAAWTLAVRVYGIERE
jgi:hypothetical protein